MARNLFEASFPRDVIEGTAYINLGNSFSLGSTHNGIVGSSVDRPLGINPRNSRSALKLIDSIQKSTFEDLDAGRYSNDLAFPANAITTPLLYIYLQRALNATKTKDLSRPTL